VKAKRNRGLLATTIVAAVTLVFMLPLAYLLLSSLRPSADLFDNLSPLTLEAIFPRNVSLDNFRNLFDTGFGRTVFNSVFIAVVSVVLGLVVNSMAAYALAAIEFPGRSVVFVIVVLSFLVPFEAIAIPLSGTFRTLGIDNGYPGLILPGVANGFAIFVLRQFFMGIPRDLREAAKIDGAGRWQVYWRIYLPLSKGPLVGAAILIFIFQWQAYLWPLLIVSNPDLQVASVSLAKLVGQWDFDAGQMLAGAVILSAIPALFVVPLQRYFTGSIARSGLK
jgi:putative chitobiose transport system permease protein